MSGIWDTKADIVSDGDNLRDISPLNSKTYKDKEGYTHYVFSKIMFNNKWYNIPEDDFELFEKLANNFIISGKNPTTVDIIKLQDDDGHYFTEDDITNKALSDTETLAAHIKIEHT